MDLREYLLVLARSWKIFLLLAAVGIAGGAVQSARTTPQYRASTTVFFSLSTGNSVSELVQGTTYTQNLVTSYAQLATMPVVLDPVIEDLGLQSTAKQLSGQITAEAPLDTVLLKITATDASPTRAAAIANGIGRQLAVAVEQLSPKSTERGETVRVTTVAAATIPRFASSPRTKLDLAAGLLLGLAVAFVIVLVRRLLDNKVRSEADVQRITDAPVLGQVALRRRRRRHGALVLDTSGHDPQVEAFRRLRTNLQSLDVDRQHRALVITSAVAGEGKSVVALNLARTLAESDLRVLLVDADLRRPSVADYLGLEGSLGLTTALLRQMPFDELVQHWGNIEVLTAGETAVRPSELLGSQAMGRLIDQMVAHYDVVLLDGAPLLPVTDSASLGKHTSGALVVVDTKRTRRQQVGQAVAALEIAGVPVHGVVLNRVSGQSDNYYGNDKPPLRVRWRQWSRPNTARQPAPQQAQAALGTSPSTRSKGPEVGDARGSHEQATSSAADGAGRR